MTNETQTTNGAAPIQARSEQNQNEFTTIRASFLALESLEQWIHDLRAEYESSKTDTETGTEGWNPDDNFGDFIETGTSEDREFARKLYGLASTLY